MIQAYLKKIKISNNLNLHLKELEKDKTKPQVSRRKEIIKVRVEINEINQTKKTIEKINETKSWYIEKTNKIEKHLAKLAKKKRGHKSIKSEMKAVTTKTT